MRILYIPNRKHTEQRLELGFDDILNANALVTYADNVDRWNLFFDLPTNGAPFVTAEVALGKKAVNYGCMYNFYTVMDSRKLAPAGCHIPTLAEWNACIAYLGGNSVAGGKLKEAGAKHWSNSNTGNNSSGFTAVGSGIRSLNGDGLFTANTLNGNFWLSTYSGIYANSSFLVHSGNNANNVTFYFYTGLGVRALVDDNTFTGTITDYDGNIYHTVKIGDQVWLVENLIVEHFNNGDAIPNIADGTARQNCGVAQNIATVQTGAIVTYSAAGATVVHAQGFNVPNCFIDNIVIQSDRNMAGYPDFKMRLSIYNVVNNLPTTKIYDSLNVIAANTAWGTITFQFGNVYLAGGSYCFVTSYEDVVVHDINNYNQISFNNTNQYTAGKLAYRVGSTWYISDVFDLVATINYSTAAMCYYNNDRTMAYTLPATITLRGGHDITVKANLFSGKTHLVLVTDYGSIVQVNTMGFNYCNGVTKFTMNVLASCLLATFQNAINATFELPELVNADTLTFAYNNSTIFDLPKLVTVGGSAFQDCHQATKFLLPKVTTLNTYAFVRCTGATEFYLPSLTTITGINIWYGLSGQTIKLTVPHAMMVVNGGGPHSEIQILMAANTVTVVEV